MEQRSREPRSASLPPLQGGSARQLRPESFDFDSARRQDQTALRDPPQRCLWGRVRMAGQGGHGKGTDTQRPVVVHPPMYGSRRVTIEDSVIGRAYSVDEPIQLLRGLGLAFGEVSLYDSTLIEWVGGGPDAWHA